MKFELIMVIIGLLSGAVMYSYYIPKWFLKVDVRSKGIDANPGGYNAYITSKPLGYLCILLDILKGFIPVYVFVKIRGIDTFWITPMLLAPIIGHAFTPFLKGKGGKALSTTAGAMLGLTGVSGVGMLLICIAIFFSTIVIVEPFSSRVVFVMLVFNITIIVFRMSNLWISLASWIITGLLWYKQYIVKIKEPVIFRWWFDKVG